MIEKEKALSAKTKIQTEVDNLRAELYGGKNESIKLIAEVRELQQNLFEKEEHCQKLETQLD